VLGHCSHRKCDKSSGVLPNGLGLKKERAGVVICNEKNRPGARKRCYGDQWIDKAPAVHISVVESIG
jgi:hypothetical protein